MDRDQERLKTLLSQAVTLLCKNGLHYEKELRIQGLLGITVDYESVFIVHFNESLSDLTSDVVSPLLTVAALVEGCAERADRSRRAAVSAGKPSTICSETDAKKSCTSLDKIRKPASFHKSSQASSENVQLPLSLDEDLTIVKTELNSEEDDDDVALVKSLSNTDAGTLGGTLFPTSNNESLDSSSVLDQIRKPSSLHKSGQASSENVQLSLDEDLTIVKTELISEEDDVLVKSLNNTDTGTLGGTLFPTSNNKSMDSLAKRDRRHRQHVLPVASSNKRQRLVPIENAEVCNDGGRNYNIRIEPLLSKYLGSGEQNLPTDEGYPKHSWDNSKTISNQEDLTSVPGCSSWIGFDPRVRGSTASGAIPRSNEQYLELERSREITPESAVDRTDILNTSFSDDACLRSGSCSSNIPDILPNCLTQSHHDESGLSILDISSASALPSKASQLALLNNILNSHALGACLLDKTDLQDESRNILTDIVANYMLLNLERPGRKDYLKFALAITARFPNEFLETYFIPSQNHRAPKGKLYWKVSNLLAKRRKMNGSVKRSYNQDVEDDMPVLDKMEEVSEEELKEEVAWLRIHNAPQSQVLDLWMKTAKVRLSQIRQSSDTIPDIVLQWPRYRDEIGYILIGQDFGMLHPSSCNKFTKNWPSVARKLWPKMQQLKDKEAKQLMAQVTSLDDSLHVSDTVMTIALILLPSLLPEPSVATLSSGKGRRRTYWKPSVSESMSYFIDVQKPGLSMSDYIGKKADDLEQKGLCLQPHVVAVIEDPSNLDNGASCFYAVISRDIYFGVPTAMTAVDICMKTVFVFDVKFPDAAKSTWLFLQRAVYEIDSHQDRSGTRMLQLLSDLNCTS